MGNQQGASLTVAQLKSTYGHRLSLIDDGVISPPEELVSATRAFVQRLDALNDHDLLVLEVRGDGFAFLAAETGDVVGELPVDPEFAAVKRWFADLGYGLVVKPDDGAFWADLSRIQSAAVVAPQYGRGESPLAAALRAKQRYQQEELGETGI